MNWLENDVLRRQVGWW